MESQYTEIIKSLSYVFYGFCFVVGAAVTAGLKWLYDMRKTQKEDVEKKIKNVKASGDERLKQALRCQEHANDIRELKNKHSEMSEWITAVEAKVDAGFKRLEDIILEAFK